jgi:hypothetical protein
MSKISGAGDGASITLPASHMERRAQRLAQHMTDDGFEATANGRLVRVQVVDLIVIFQVNETGRPTVHDVEKAAA